MKKILIPVILVLLLCVGTGSAVAINDIQKQAVPMSTARDNANAALISYAAQGKLGSLSGAWKGASLSASPITIYDACGVPYSYLFDVVKDGRVIGEVNAAANKLVGTPVIGVETTPRTFEPSVVVEKARERALSEYPGASISYILFTMLDSKKVGVMVILNDGNRQDRRLLYDIGVTKTVADQISYPGLVFSTDRNSVFAKMSSSQASTAVQNYDRKIQTQNRTTPTMKRIIPRNYIKTTPSQANSILKSGEKSTDLTEPYTVSGNTGFQVPARFQGVATQYPAYVMPRDAV